MPEPKFSCTEKGGLVNQDPGGLSRFSGQKAGELGQVGWVGSTQTDYTEGFSGAFTDLIQTMSSAIRSITTGWALSLHDLDLRFGRRQFPSFKDFW